jgi:hypothetical protein
MMRYGQLAALCASLLPLPAFAQEDLPVPGSQPAWTASASLFAYWPADDDNYRSPSVSVDRDDPTYVLSISLDLQGLRGL